MSYSNKTALSFPNLVFVYGSLKKGEPNHPWITNPKHGKAKFWAKGQLVRPHPLIISSRYNIPYMLDAPGVGKYVKGAFRCSENDSLVAFPVSVTVFFSPGILGEIYNVDDNMLKSLDVIEDAPNYYIRRQEEIDLVDKEGQVSNPITCWLYILPDFKEELLNDETEFLTEYCNAKQERKFVER